MYKIGRKHKKTGAIQYSYSTPHGVMWRSSAENATMYSPMDTRIPGGNLVKHINRINSDIFEYEYFLQSV